LSVEVIESKFSRRSAVRSSVWLDLFVELLHGHVKNCAVQSVAHVAPRGERAEEQNNGADDRRDKPQRGALQYLKAPQGQQKGTTEESDVGQYEKWSEQEAPQTEPNDHEKGDALGQNCEYERNKKPRTEESFVCASHRSNETEVSYRHRERAVLEVKMFWS
jgi:hypothetical protein